MGKTMRDVSQMTELTVALCGELCKGNEETLAWSRWECRFPSNVTLGEVLWHHLCHVLSAIRILCVADTRCVHISFKVASTALVFDNSGTPGHSRRVTGRL